MRRIQTLVTTIFLEAPRAADMKESTPSSRDTEGRSVAVVRLHVRFEKAPTCCAALVVPAQTALPRSSSLSSRCWPLTSAIFSLLKLFTHIFLLAFAASSVLAFINVYEDMDGVWGVRRGGCA